MLAPSTSSTRARRLRLGVGLVAASLVAPIALAASAPPASAADPPGPVWPIDWDLNPSHDIDELSRNFDRNSDGIIDADANADVLLPQILNPAQSSVHTAACAVPAGFVSIDWQLVRPSGGDPLPVVTSTTCEADIPLPDKPYPDALEYDLRVAVHYANVPDIVQTTRIRVQDIFMVGLGDSYGSGEGNPLSDGDVLFGDDAGWDDTRCHRSRLAGQEQAALMLDQIDGINVTFLHLACSGAKAATGILGPYDGLIGPNPGPLRPQITQAADYVTMSAATGSPARYPDVVVTSIGGNDAGFSDVVMGCLYPGWYPVPIPVFPYVVPIDVDECHEQGAARTEIFDKRLPNLEGLYAELEDALEGEHPQLPGLCPQARGCEFLITEYPDGATDEEGETCEYLGFREEEFQWVIDDMVPRLNAEIQRAATEHEWHYVDGVREAFHTHGICSEQAWLRDITESLQVQGDKWGAFHPTVEGHLFGYAPAIVDTLRDVLGFPAPARAMPAPGYGGTGAPATCDSTVGDGRLERFTAAPPTDLTGLTLPSDIVRDMESGQLPSASVGTTSCSARTAVVSPVNGAAPREVRSGNSGCPVDPRACSGSDAGSAVVRLPIWTDEQPVIVASASADVESGAGGPADFRHRSGASNAHARTAFLAAPFGGSATVEGEVVVDLQALTQASGSNAYSSSNVDVTVRSVSPDEDCSSGECAPNTIRTIAELHVDVERSSCEEAAPYEHSCATSFGFARSRYDDWSVSATVLDDEVLREVGDRITPTGGAAGSAVPVGSGGSAPVRFVRLPYAVPAGTVVTIEVDAGAYATATEGCVLDWNEFTCRAQARAGLRVAFEADVATGALMPLSGFQPPSVDTTAPTTSVSVTGTAGDAGWYRSPVAVTIDAADAQSGVATVHHRVDGGEAVDTAGSHVVVPVGANGTHVVEHWATDAAGNMGARQSTTVRIDAAAPTIAVDPAAGAQVVQGAQVQTALRCEDLLSGVASCTGPTVLDTTTLGERTATFTARDLAGNTTTLELAYRVVAPAPPPPPRADTITLTIPQLSFTVTGPVTSGGFTITRTRSGEAVAVNGRATVMASDGSVTTVEVGAIKVLGVWIGATSVRNVDRRIDVTGAVLSRTAVREAAANALSGSFTTARPTRTITWTITDLV